MRNKFRGTNPYPEIHFGGLCEINFAVPIRIPKFISGIMRNKFRSTNPYPEIHFGGLCEINFAVPFRIPKFISRIMRNKFRSTNPYPEIYFGGLCEINFAVPVFYSPTGALRFAEPLPNELTGSSVNLLAFFLGQT